MLGHTAQPALYATHQETSIAVLTSQAWVVPLALAVVQRAVIHNVVMLVQEVAAIQGAVQLATSMVYGGLSLNVRVITYIVAGIHLLAAMAILYVSFFIVAAEAIVVRATNRTGDFVNAGAQLVVLGVVLPRQHAVMTLAALAFLVQQVLVALLCAKIGQAELPVGI